MMGFLKTFKFLFYYSFTFEKLWTFTIYVHITIIDNENQMGHPQIIIVPWKVSHILLINIHVFAINVNVDNYMKYLCNRYITLNKLVLFYCGTLYKEQTVISRDDCKGKLSMVCEKDWGISIYKYIDLFLINCIQAKLWCVSPKLKHFQFNLLQKINYFISSCMIYIHLL